MDRPTLLDTFFTLGGYGHPAPLDHDEYTQRPPQATFHTGVYTAANGAFEQSGVSYSVRHDYRSI